MSLELPPDDPWVARGYGQQPIEPGSRPAVLVVDLQYAFTDFHGTPLVSLLAAAQRDTVIVTGCMTSGCVRATTVDAFSYGYRTLVPEDCVGDQGLDAHLANLRDVHRRYAEVTTAAEVVEYLTGVTAGVTA